MYRALDREKILSTARTLERRIEERFADSGLARVAKDIVAVGEMVGATAKSLKDPYLPVRVVVALGLLLLAAGLAGVWLALDFRVAAFSSLAELFQGIDSTINDIVFIGVGVFFLFSWETRVKRKRALAMVRELRAMAHIIDMHQLTKDPERLTTRGNDTQSSPARRMSPFELTRYLDYCSEMLSIISKLGALLVQDFADPQTLTAVNEIEELTSGLSRKIWQKIIILDRLLGSESRGLG